MNKGIEIEEITTKQIEEGKLKEVFPEFYQLQNVIENNGCHKNETVFWHCLASAKKLPEAIEICSSGIRKHLQQKIGAHTRQQLLFLATLFHDIGKSGTMVRREDETTFPCHEAIGALKVKPWLKRISLTPAEQEFIIALIHNHATIHLLVAAASDQAKRDNKNGKLTPLLYYVNFKAAFPAMFQELTILGMADRMGSSVSELQPEAFAYMTQFYKQVLSEER